jgi:hypothetical protein
MTIAAVFILVFFTVYSVKLFCNGGQTFSLLFGIPYQYLMIGGAIFVAFIRSLEDSCGEYIGLHARYRHDRCACARSYTGLVMPAALRRFCLIY